MNINITTYGQLRMAIMMGHLDDHLADLREECRQRKEVLDYKASAGITVGDRVRIHSVRPLYLVGLIATVTSIDGQMASVKFDEPMRAKRFAYGCSVKLKNLHKVAA